MFLSKSFSILVISSCLIYVLQDNRRTPSTRENRAKVRNRKWIIGLTGPKSIISTSHFRDNTDIIRTFLRYTPTSLLCGKKSIKPIFLRDKISNICMLGPTYILMLIIRISYRFWCFISYFYYKYIFNFNIL